jgi:uncharacterized membrane protein
MMLMFILGLSIGAAIGVILMAILNAATYEDMLNEVREMLDKM